MSGHGYCMQIHLRVIAYPNRPVVHSQRCECTVQALGSHVRSVHRTVGGMQLRLKSWFPVHYSPPPVLLDSDQTARSPIGLWSDCSESKWIPVESQWSPSGIQVESQWNLTGNAKGINFMQCSSLVHLVKFSLSAHKINFVQSKAWTTDIGIKYHRMTKQVCSTSWATGALFVYNTRSIYDTQASLNSEVIMFFLTMAK